MKLQDYNIQIFDVRELNPYRKINRDNISERKKKTNVYENVLYGNKQ